MATPSEAVAPAQRPQPTRLLSPDEIVAAAAAVLAAKAFLAGNKKPVLTGSMVAKALQAPAVTKAIAASISPATLASAHSFALGTGGQSVIANATAVAANVLRRKIALHATKSSSGETHPPTAPIQIQRPISTGQSHPPISVKPLNQKGHSLV